MKDTSRPNINPSSRFAPYRKRRSSTTVSPSRPTCRANDASPHSPDRAHSSHRDEAQSSRALPSADNDCRELSKMGGSHAVSPNHTRKRHTSTDGSARHAVPLQTSALSIHADVPGPPLRLPLTPALPTTTASSGPSKAESPTPGSVTAFLRTIELPDNLSPSMPHLQPSLTPTFAPRCPPPLSTDNTNKAACTNGNSYQVSLTYKGYPFTYDLSALPDDPKGPITLLSITKSDPGAYILVGAHYRRTGRSRAACAVIRSLLETLDSTSDTEAKGDVTAPPPVTASDTSTATLVSPGSPGPAPKPMPAMDWTASVYKSTAVRPAMLLLAACELDISREDPEDPESASHASAAHDLFRAVYGTVNDGIVAGALRPPPKNALGLELASDKNGVIPPSDSKSHPPGGAVPEAESVAHIKVLEKELSVARTAQHKLQEKLTTFNARLTRAQDRVHAVESCTRAMRIDLDASRDENRELRRRLADSEQRAREFARCVPSAESRVWGRLKDLFFDNLGGGVRGE